MQHTVCLLVCAKASLEAISISPTKPGTHTSSCRFLLQILLVLHALASKETAAECMLA